MSPAWSLVALSVPPFAVMDPMVTEESVGATWHTVSVVLVQAVCAPYVHVASTMHAAHGEPPEEDQVEPARHGVGHSEAQSVS